MPQFIDNADFDMKLTRLSSNRVETAAFLEGKPTSFALPDYIVQPGYSLSISKLAQEADGIVQVLCLTFNNNGEHETVYKVKIIERPEPNPYMRMKNCTQLIVWRQIGGIHSGILAGFPSRVFNHLLNTHDVMITDELQTQDGKRFWLDRMGESFVIADRRVYYVDLDELDENQVPIVESISDAGSLFEKYVPLGWGSDPEHKNRAFIISKKNLV